ncbi:MAG: hypothetical protein R3327_06155 [Nitrosopumilaceae archaeon]|nr:hypothetical protein [Nitrosopumilaceae archaeon]
MIKLTSSEKIVLKRLANFDSISSNYKIDVKTLDPKLIEILRQYYRENTQNLSKNVTRQLNSIGIDEEQGKFMLATARRLGIEIF